MPFKYVTSLIDSRVKTHFNISKWNETEWIHTRNKTQNNYNVQYTKNTPGKIKASFVFLVQ